MLTQLDNTTALVAGASGGIGCELVAQLAQSPQWCRIYALARRASACNPLAALRARDARIRLLDIDLTGPEAAAQLTHALSDLERPLGLVCNTTGTLHDADRQPEKRLQDCRADSLLHSLTVNSLPPLILAQAVAPHFPRHSAAIFASFSARVGSIGDNRQGGWYSYRASKAAHNMLIANLAIELRRRHRGLTTLAYHPGTVDTGLSRPFQARVPAERLFTPAHAARCFLQVLAELDTEDNGAFLAWDGSRIPW